MSARNPGPYLNQIPIGFPSFNNKCRRDWLVRQAFLASEVPSRVYKNAFETLGFKGRILINNKIGISKIRMRCIQSGYGRGIYRYTRMSRMPMLQVMREGWLEKYGFNSSKCR
ncbi:putative ribosomal protein S14 precursor [Cardiosporidium cionae]|uniref:Ribosomal protein S14 n=1 Tax=Cardiosporidium cionae TaxID=476202 RepID=A0ABQ7J7K7_9APIC|nr:putative ribosomal protein S14 precursor [Cardiosporidium cionae]|eukprot:KAF8819964.1 putative ribosomal protein S14 precursor [Cardiosporidium cionae]